MHVFHLFNCPVMGLLLHMQNYGLRVFEKKMAIIFGEECKMCLINCPEVMGFLPDNKIAGCACAWNAGNISPPPWVSDLEMHHGTCVTHVPWCMLGSLTSSFLWSRWRGKCSRHSRHMRNPHFYYLVRGPWLQCNWLNTFYTLRQKRWRIFSK